MKTYQKKSWGSWCRKVWVQKDGAIAVTIKGETHHMIYVDGRGAIDNVGGRVAWDMPVSDRAAKRWLSLGQ